MGKKMLYLKYPHSSKKVKIVLGRWDRKRREVALGSKLLSVCEVTSKFFLEVKGTYLLPNPPSFTPLQEEGEHQQFYSLNIMIVAITRQYWLEGV